MKEEHLPKKTDHLSAADIVRDLERRLTINPHPFRQHTPSWTIESVASELLSLYRFLIFAYMPEWKLRVPPPEGWPQITKERFAALRKDDIAIELIKHLPYIRCDDFDSTMIWTDCRCNDYAGLILQNAIANDRDWSAAESPMLRSDENEPLESHRVVIADVGSINGWSLIFDTQDGSVLNWSPMYVEEETFASMAELVQHIKDSFISMDVIAINETELEYTGQHHEDVLTPLRQALTRNGWPGEIFDKAAYLREVAEIREEPDPEREDIDLDGEQTPYSVRHVAAQLLSLYQFLVRMYIPEDMLRIPPRRGWQLISHHRFGDLLGSDNRVGDLLQHLPYIRQDFQDRSVSMISAGCVCVDYSGQLCHQYFMMDDKRHETFPHDPLPAHKIALATDSNMKLKSIVFDTSTGNIERFGKDRQVQYFRCIDDLVACIKQEFTSLQVIPVDERTVLQSMQGQTQSESLRAIFSRHGWPTEQYTKHQCLQEVQSAILEQQGNAQFSEGEGTRTPSDTMLESGNAYARYIVDQNRRT